METIRAEITPPPKRGMEVYCRLKGGKKSCSDQCMNVISDSELQISKQTEVGVSFKYKFKKVFNLDASQKFVFDHVALQFIQDLLTGKSGLLFAYGVTGSGKTFTMTGTKEEPGIMPRCLDVIFNSISQFMASKYVFKPDKMNGFDIQSEIDAALEREQDIRKFIPQKDVKQKLEKVESLDDLLGRSRDSSRVPYLNEDNLYAVFVTYIEIYNNNVYDLLEDLHSDSGKPKPLQSKIVREDSSHYMYVHGVTEVEVRCPEEAFEIFYKGQKRKHIAQTTLNNESSRAHTVFNIRVVQAPLDEKGEELVADKSAIAISQLSLVDLAGSERSLRTKNTGQRLREAGNINNSLMSLRMCLEILRDNQNGGNKMIPYRESRLTHLFKNYFEGEGHISMMICISPYVDDLDETLHVLKFAEMSQEIMVTKSQVRPNCLFTPGRRKANLAFKEALKDYDVIFKDPLPEEKVVIEKANNTSESDQSSEIAAKSDSGFRTPMDMFYNSIASVSFVDFEDENTLPDAIHQMENNLEVWNNLTNVINKKAMDVRDVLLNRERERVFALQEVISVKSSYEIEKKKVAELDVKSHTMDEQIKELKRKLNDSDMRERRMKRQLFDKNIELEKVKLEKSSTKEMMKNKIREAEEKLTHQLELKLEKQKHAIKNEIKKRDNKLKEVRRIVSASTVISGSKSPSLASLLPSESEDHPVPSDPPPTPRPSTPTDRSYIPDQRLCRTTARRIGIPTANRRHRRSKSADVWLDHRPAISVPLGTVMQPKMEKRKSVSKLTQAKDITEKTSKYCLMTQSQDSDGDLETRLYKRKSVSPAEKKFWQPKVVINI